MSHILGVHWIPIHNRASDIEYIRRLQPGSVKIVDPDVAQISAVHQAAPDALIVLRDWPLSEQHDDMRRDPEGTGQRHARRWHDKWLEYQMQATQRGMLMPSRDNVIVLGVNEPRVWDALGETVRYTVAFLDECTSLGLRAGALNLSVGWPDNTGPDTPANWEPYAPVESAIKRGRHFLFLHEYHDERGVNHNWKWWCGRFEWCPWNVPIIIGECGLDKGVATADFETHKRGWRGWYDPARYADELFKYAELCAQDGRIHSIQPFTTDGAREWQSFDTEAAHGEILNKQWPKVGKHTVLIPNVSVKPGLIKYVSAPAGLNVRAAPRMDAKVIDKLPHGTPVRVVDVFGVWQKIGLDAWVHGDWLSETKPEPVKPTPAKPEPPVVPSGDKWERSYAFTARWEGGFQNHRNDKGNWTGGEVGKGELKGTNWGISAASYPHLDIRNLTKEQAKAIYFRDYWQKSGADKLDWPGCLIVFDTAVLHGVGRAQQWLQAAGPNPLYFSARRLRSYTHMDNWHFWGAAWTRRVADLLEEAAK